MDKDKERRLLETAMSKIKREPKQSVKTEKSQNDPKEKEESYMDILIKRAKEDKKIYDKQNMPKAKKQLSKRDVKYNPIRKMKKSGEIKRHDSFEYKGKIHKVCGIIEEDINYGRKTAVWDENGKEYDINDVSLLTKQVSLGKDRDGKSLLILTGEMLEIIGIDTDKPYSRREVAKQLEKYLKEKVAEDRERK